MKGICDQIKPERNVEGCKFVKCRDVQLIETDRM